MIRLCIDVQMPDVALACQTFYDHGVAKRPDEELPKYEWEEFDRYLYRQCTNYKRYLRDNGVSAGALVRAREKKEKDEAKQAAIMLAFDQLSSDEQDIFLTGKIQRGSGDESRKPGSIDQNLTWLERNLSDAIL
ncbi:hypothetical protein BOTCAL_0145g00070 [Botryotinia calthae]|uniref:Uncharacterized protein n=1 Tax=Botryotinia calthae TaxID=38488 RepID=A0A4Y8D2R3_9HELO|nr:hypothetical protein BOTCAL_0145g00070 [Botryotinia calthae]